MSDKAIYLDMDTFDDMLKAKQGTELRDQFAMAALQGLLAGRHRFDPSTTVVEPVDYIVRSYKFADAMLEARK